MTDIIRIIVLARAKKNKPLKNGPISATTGFYSQRVGDASCVLKNMQKYKKLPTDLPTTTTTTTTTTAPPTTTTIMTSTELLPTLNTTCICK